MESSASNWLPSISSTEVTLSGLGSRLANQSAPNRASPSTATCIAAETAQPAFFSAVSMRLVSASSRLSVPQLVRAASGWSVTSPMLRKPPALSAPITCITQP